MEQVMELRERRLPPAGFGEMLRAARERRGLPRRQVAEAVEIDRSYVGNLENGRRVPGIVVAQALAEVLALGEDERALLFSVAVVDAGRGWRKRSRRAAQLAS